MHIKLVEKLSNYRFLWILSGVLPLLLFALVMLLLFTRQQEKAIRQLLHEASITSAHVVDRAIGEQIGLLSGLAASRSLDNGDFEAFRLEAMRFHDMHPEWITVILTDRHRQVFNLRFPPGKPVPPVRDRISLDIVWQTGKPLVGNLVRNHVAIRIPVIRDNRVIYTLVVPTAPRFFYNALQTYPKTQQWEFIVAGSDHGVITSSVQDRMSSRGFLSFRQEDIRALYGADMRYSDPASIRSGPWEIIVFAPAASIETPFLKKRLVVYTGGSLATILTLILVLTLNSIWATRQEAISLHEEIRERERVQEALQKSEQSYRALVEDLPVLICSFYPGGNIRFANRAYCEYFGKTPEDLAGSSFLALIPEADRKNVTANIAALTRENPIHSHEHPVAVSEKDIRWQRWTNRALFDEQGKLLVYQSIGEDITERKQAETSLKKERKRFRQILDNFPFGICIMTQDFQAEFVNPPIVRDFGFPGKSGPDEYSCGSVPYFYHHDEKVFQGETIYWEWDCPANGRYYEVTDIPLGNEDGSISKLEVFKDVTDRKWAEKDHRQSEERYRSLVENTLNGYFICEIPSGKFIFLNQRFCDLFGFTRQETLALSLRDVIAFEDYEKIQERIQENNSGKISKFTSNIYNAIRKNGPGFRIEMSISIVSYEDNSVIQGVLRDITEEERLQLQLRQSQKMESIGLLAGGVAHDYNNMISVIIGYSELALEETGLDRIVHEYLNEILKAARRSSNITRQLLAFARQQTIAPKVLDLNETIEGMLRMLRRLIGENIDLAWHPEEGLGSVKMDPTQVNQLLANLCVNARDAISDVGKITIETGNRTFDTAYCATHPGFVPGDFVMMAVSDDGCGMDRDTMSRIFEPFFTTKEVGRGTGLGLATIYGIVKQNHGFVNVYSEPDKGSTFRIYLPRHDGEDIERIMPGIEGIPAGKNEMILVVEDEPATLQLAEKMLTGLGYRVLAAQKPTEALGLAGTHPGGISLLLTDVVMPEMNGRELFGQIKLLCPELKCLFMSGYTANVIAHRGILEDGVNFIQKPFSKAELAARIRLALDGNRE